MKSQTLQWLNDLLGQFIEGASDAFLIVQGGSVATQATSTPLTVNAHQLGLSVLIGGALYAASFLKKNPTPFTHENQTAPVAPATSAPHA